MIVFSNSTYYNFAQPWSFQTKGKLGQLFFFSVQYYHHKETSQLIFKSKSVDWIFYDGNIER